MRPCVCCPETKTAALYSASFPCRAPKVQCAQQAALLSAGVNNLSTSACSANEHAWISFFSATIFAWQNPQTVACLVVLKDSTLFVLLLRRQYLTYTHYVRRLRRRTKPVKYCGRWITREKLKKREVSSKLFALLPPPNVKPKERITVISVFNMANGAFCTYIVRVYTRHWVLILKEWNRMLKSSL